MGSFRDAFSKGEKKEFLLNYDTAAFYYFIFVILLCIFVPLVCFVSKRFIWKISGWESLPLNYLCKCSKCDDVKAKYKKDIKSSWLTCGLVVQARIGHANHPL